MPYKVIGAAAVVELDDGKADLGTGTRVYLEENQLVPDNAKKAHVKHLVDVGLIKSVTKAEVAADAAPTPPADPPPAS